MSPRIDSQEIDLEKSAFEFSEESYPPGAWWWWFWMFFIDNPKDPERPRQLMILWSIKNTKEIVCNGKPMTFPEKNDFNDLTGVQAAWYYDGETMHHNHILEKGRLRLTGNTLEMDGETPTRFSIHGKKSTVTIGESMSLTVEEPEGHPFNSASYHKNTFIGDRGYSIMKVNRGRLRGLLDGGEISGTAYFQRVFVNAPAVPWYWGIFHLTNGGTLTYTNQRILGKSLKKDISYHDGKTLHRIKDIKVGKTNDKHPTFRIWGEDDNGIIAFTIKSYSHSFWEFTQKKMWAIPNRLTYNEYPATIEDFTFEDKKTREKTTMEYAGYGNAEHTTGYLL
jgi:hypothetical protein